MTAAPPSLLQRGNVLFLILLAIVLFVALTYAVMGQRDGSKNASGESAQAQAADLMNFFTQLDTAVQRMMLTGGVKDYELNFYYQGNNRFTQGAYDNANCTESRCRVYDPAGGGVSGRNFSEYILPGGTANTAGNTRIFLTSVSGVGTSRPDLVMTIYHVKPEICLEINKRTGLNDMVYNTPIYESPGAFFYYLVQPAGPFPDATTTLVVPDHIGQSGTFCTCQNASYANCLTSWNPILHHVLVAR